MKHFNTAPRFQKAALPEGVVYTAVGKIYGTYRPSRTKLTEGVLVTPDGQEFAARPSKWFQAFLKKRYAAALADGSIFQQPHRWGVYPKTFPELHFELIRFWDNAVGEAETDGTPHLTNDFRIVGAVVQTRESDTILRIWRNDPKPKALSQTFDSFTLKLQGGLPLEAVGTVWRIEAVRVGRELRIDKAEPVLTVGESSGLIEAVVLSRPVTAPARGRSAIPAVALSVAVNDRGELIDTFVEPPAVAQQTIDKPKSTTTSTASAIDTKTTAARSRRSEKQPSTNAKPTQRFSVQVGQQTLAGNRSVHLRDGMLLIDGKPVARAKVAIVQGKPQQCSADGRVQQSGDSKTVLIGR